MLKEDLKGLLSYGVGRIRIVYRIAPKRTIELITIGPRKTIYEETYRALKKEVEKK
jgi:mRNA-degrading endonuclease RelE of RelBE toxin-antitoxin system